MFLLSRKYVNHEGSCLLRERVIGWLTMYYFCQVIQSLLRGPFLIWLIMERKPLVIILMAEWSILKLPYSSFDLILLNNYFKLFWNKMVYCYICKYFITICKNFVSHNNLSLNGMVEPAYSNLSCVSTDITWNNLSQ